jgi:superkiller protein 3
MKAGKQQLWDKLMSVWGGDTPACSVYLAEFYTKEFPDDHFGWLVLADGLIDISSFETAAEALRNALRICPLAHRGLVYSKAGKFYREKGSLIRAEKWYRKAVTLDPSQEHLIFLGACIAKQGRYNDATDLHQQAINAAPDTADEAYFNLGLVHRANKNYLDALRNFEKAIEIDPEYDDAITAILDIRRLLELRAEITKKPAKKLPEI